MPNLLAQLSGGGFTEGHFNAAELFGGGHGDPFDSHLAARTYSGWFIGTGYEYARKWLPS